MAAALAGEITADSLYTLDEIKARTGLGTAALRQARRSGLRVKYIGRKGYIIGADLIAYVRDTARSEK